MMQVEKLSSNSFKATMKVSYIEELGINLDDLAVGYLPYVNTLLNEISANIFYCFEYDLLSECGGELGIELQMLDKDSLAVFVGSRIEQNVKEEMLNEKEKFDCERDILVEFKDIEDIISLSKVMKDIYTYETSLYSYSNRYYVYMKYDVDELEEYLSEKDILNDEGPLREMLMDKSIKFLDNIYSILSEYGVQSNYSFEVLKEYGKCIINGSVFEQIDNKFNK